MKRTWGRLAVLASLALGLAGAPARAADRCESSCERSTEACQDVCKDYKGKKSVVLAKCKQLCADTKKRCLDGCEAKAQTPPPKAPAAGGTPTGTQAGGGVK